MRTRVLTVDALRPDPSTVAAAAEVLRRDGLVAFPTETVYGLGADALNAAAVAGIFAAKGRPAHNPVIVHVADAADVPRVASSWPDEAARLAERFWPGPLTLVLPRAAAMPDVVTAGGPTVAVRVPAHPVALALIRAAGVPVAAPSANRSALLSPTCAAHVLKGLDGRIDLLLDGGPAPGGIESTVLDLTASPPRLLRPGLVGPDELADVLGPVDVGSAAGGALRSPGLLARHYAPRTPLEVVEGDGRRRVEELLVVGLRVGWLTFGDGGGPGVTVVRLPPEPKAAAAALYAALHRLDDAGLDRLVADLPPDEPRWLAVRDRLRRAAAD
jgi:L-threonylcarbamoyladenylate synthase